MVPRTSDGFGMVKDDITPVVVPSSRMAMIIKKNKITHPASCFLVDKPFPTKGTGLLIFILLEELELCFFTRHSIAQNQLLWLHHALYPKDVFDIDLDPYLLIFDLRLAFQY